VGVIAAQRHSEAAYVGGFMGTVALSAGLAVLGRAMTAKITLIARSRRWAQRRALVVGGGPVAADLAQLIRQYPRYGLTMFGSLSPSETDTDDLLPWHGGPDQIGAAIARTRAEVVLLADPEMSEAALLAVAQRTLLMRCKLYLVPVLHTQQHCGGAHDHIGAIPVLQVGRPHLDGPRLAAKRLLDVMAALLGLLITTPILVLCLAAARMECGKGVLFRQTRVGRHGRLFPLLKIRTIRADSGCDPDTEWSVDDGPRIGPVGRLLRRTSLDELPQLWNILCGDMTLVGPRPERPHFVELFSELHQGYAERHRAPVGLTGLAQVSGLRGDTSIRDRARYDNYYIEHWSMWLDIKVLLRTVGEVIRGGGR
jgi:exopolysaccharide biosynthesis polyprenyl glycosylphosphotransferase